MVYRILLSYSTRCEGSMSEDRIQARVIEDRRLRLLIDAVVDYAIYMIDPDGIITSWNAGARRFKGYEEAEILGQHFSRFLHR